MANRAYLFSSDFPSEDWPDMLIEDNRPFYDSRHTLPLAWFFFFYAADIRLDDDAIYFAADRQSACNYFLTKKALIQELAGVNPDCLDELVRNVSSWPSGNFLLLRPALVGNFFEENLSYVQRILGTIEMAQASASHIKQSIQSFPEGGIVTDFSLSESDEMDLVGCTYW